MQTQYSKIGNTPIWPTCAAPWRCRGCCRWYPVSHARTSAACQPTAWAHGYRVEGWSRGVMLVVKLYTFNTMLEADWLEEVLFRDDAGLRHYLCPCPVLSAWQVHPGNSHFLYDPIYAFPSQLIIQHVSWQPPSHVVPICLCSSHLEPLNTSMLETTIHWWAYLKNLAGTLLHLINLWSTIDDSQGLDHTAGCQVTTHHRSSTCNYW